MGKHNGIFPPARPLVSFTPMNMQEHENDIRAIVNTHMGGGDGNPSAWVIRAGIECHARGFGEGWAAAQASGARPSPPTQQQAPDWEPPPSLMNNPIQLRQSSTEDAEVVLGLVQRVNKAGDGLEFAKPPRSIRETIRADNAAQERHAWRELFKAALAGTAASAGSPDNIVNLAREIADTALQAWREH